MSTAHKDDMKSAFDSETHSEEGKPKGHVITHKRVVYT